MTKDELIERLLVERHLPLPPTPQAGVPYDHPNDQASRRAALLEEIEAFEKDPGRKRPTVDDSPRLVQRRGIWVADRSAA